MGIERTTNLNEAQSRCLEHLGLGPKFVELKMAHFKNEMVLGINSLTIFYRAAKKAEITKMRTKNRGDYVGLHYLIEVPERESTKKWVVGLFPRADSFDRFKSKYGGEFTYN